MKDLTKKSGISAEEIKQVLDAKGIKYVEWHPKLRHHAVIKSGSDIEYMAKSALDEVIVTKNRARKLIRKTLGNSHITGYSGDNIIYGIFYASYQINSLDFIKSIPYFQKDFMPGYIRFRKTGEIERLTKVIYDDKFLR